MKTTTFKPSILVASLAFVFVMALTVLPSQAQTGASSSIASPWCGNGNGHGGTDANQGQHMRHPKNICSWQKNSATAASLSGCGGHRGPGLHDRKGTYGPRNLPGLYRRSTQPKANKNPRLRPKS